jgi:outer membrane autotransporter protein
LNIWLGGKTCSGARKSKAWESAGLVAVLSAGFFATGGTVAEAQQVVSGDHTDLQVTTNGDITQLVSPALNVTGTTELDAGSGKIVLTNTDNVFGGTFSAAATGLDLTSSTALALYDTDIIGNATVKATGAITQAGYVQVTGTASFEATGSITLTNASNALGLVTAVSTGGSISLADVSGLAVGTLRAAAGNVTLSSAGAITQTSGAITANKLTVSSASNVDLSGAGNAVGTLNVVGANNFKFANSQSTTLEGISASSVELTVAGTATATADITGNVTMLGGLLSLGSGADINGGVGIMSGAGLGGSGTVKGNVTIESGGTLTPGNGGIGTLAVGNAGTGNLTLKSGSTYEVEVNPGVAADLVNVQGNVTLEAGSILDLTVDPLGPSGPVTLIATANGMVSGTFGTVLSDYAFLLPELSYEAKAVKLELVKLAFADRAETPNQAAVAAAVDSAGAGNPLYDAILALPDDDALIAASFSALSGAFGASITSALVEQSGALRGTLNHRLGLALSGGGEAVPLMSYAPTSTPLAAEPTTGVWFAGLSSWGKTGSDGNAAALDRTAWGFVTGADTQLGDWQVGLAAGYNRSNFDAPDAASSGSSNDFSVAGYAGTAWDSVSLRTALTYTLHDVASERTVVLPGITDALSASYLAGTVQGLAELDYDIYAGDALLQPFVNLAYVNVTTEGYTEEGGPAALTVERNTTGVGFTTLGVRAEQVVAVGEHDATLTGGIGWRHGFGELTPTATQAFSAGDAFSVFGVPIAEDTATLEAGLDLALGAGTSLGVAYAGQLAADAASHAVSARIDGKF